MTCLRKPKPTKGCSANGRRTEKRTVNESGVYVDFIYKSSPPVH